MTSGGFGGARIVSVALKPVDPRHADVHQHDVGRQGLDLAIASAPSPASPTTSMASPCEQHPQPGAHERVVVDDQHPDRRRLRGGHAGHGSHASRR